MKDNEIFWLFPENIDSVFGGREMQFETEDFFFGGVLQD